MRCARSLELDLTGNRTVLMGRVAGVLTSQMNGWGRIKRSLRRNGLQSSLFQEPEPEVNTNDAATPEIAVEEFHAVPARSLLEDASDALLIGMDNQPNHIGGYSDIHASVGDAERMVGTILRGHGGSWGILRGISCFA